MFEKLKRQSLKKSLIFTVILVAAAVALLVSTGFGVFKAIGGPKDLYSLSRDQVDGAYVEGEIYGLYGSYAETTKNSRTVSREYIIGVTDEVGYMGLVLRSEDLSAAEDLLQESWDYLDGLTDGTSTVIHVRGTILPMDEESLEFYHETVGWDEMSAEQQAMFLPYYLKADFLGKSHADATWGFTVLAAAALAWAVYRTVRAATGGYQSELRKLCAAAPEGAEVAAERMEQFYENTEPVGLIRIGEDWVVWQDGAKTRGLATRDIVWAYCRHTTRRRNGFKTGEFDDLMLWTRDKKNRAVRMASGEQTAQAMQVLNEANPDVLLGYSKEIEKLYRKDPESLRGLKDDASAQQ